MAAIRADPKLTARQRQALLEVYERVRRRAGALSRGAPADGRGAGAPRPPVRGRGAQETSSRAALVYAFASSRVKSACAAAALAIQSTFVAPAAFS